MKAKGVNKIKKLFANKGKELNRKSNGLVKDTALIGRSVAVSKAPSAFGKLRQGINIKTGYLRSTVYSQMPYSVYVEFGTGRKVRIPSYTPEPLKRAAALMRNQKGGSFDDFLQRLSKWARLKGIPPEAVYPMALSILKNGTKPQPFMRPAFIASRKALILGLKRL